MLGFRSTPVSATNVILGEDHKRQFDEKSGEEADFMAGELLIPLAGTSRMAFDGWDHARVAAAYDVSPQFAQKQHNAANANTTSDGRTSASPRLGDRSGSAQAPSGPVRLADTEHREIVARVP